MTPFLPRLTTQIEVERFWQTLIRPLGWRHRSVWFVVIGPDDLPIPAMNEIDELPDLADGLVADRLAAGLRRILDRVEPDGRLALLISRPGAGGLTDEDRCAAGSLYAGCRRHRLPVEVIHVATDTEVLPVPADDTFVLTA